MLKSSNIIRQKKQNGFTLIEILIYITFVSIISMVFFTFAFNVVGTAKKARLRQEIQQNVRFGMARMTQETRAANGLNIASSTFDVNPSVLSISTDNPLNDPTVFDVSGGVLRMTQGAGAAQALTSGTFNVTNFVVKNRSVSGRTTIVRFELTVAHPNPENIEIFNASITMKGSAVIREDED